MAAPVSLVAAQFVTIDTLFIDCATVEEHTFDSEITKYPVEQGVSVADHVRRLPTRVTIEGIVSDSPIGRMVAQRDSESFVIETADGIEIEQRSLKPSEFALAKLLAIHEAGEPVTVGTSLRVFPNMALESLTIPRDAETGFALRFRATFEQVRLVTNERTTIRTARPSGKKKRNLGGRGLVIPILPGVLEFSEDNLRAATVAYLDSK